MYCHCLPRSGLDGAGILEVSRPLDAVGVDADGPAFGVSFCVGEDCNASVKSCFKSVASSAGDAAAAEIVLGVCRGLPARQHAFGLICTRICHKHDQSPCLSQAKITLRKFPRPPGIPQAAKVFVTSLQAVCTELGLLRYATPLFEFEFCARHCCYITKRQQATDCMRTTVRSIAPHCVMGRSPTARLHVTAWARLVGVHGPR